MTAKDLQDLTPEQAYEQTIQNDEILGRVDPPADCDGHCGSCGCGNRERIPTIWYVVTVVIIVLAALGLKALGVL